MKVIKIEVIKIEVIKIDVIKSVVIKIEVIKIEVIKSVVIKIIVIKIDVIKIENSWGGGALVWGLFSLACKRNFNLLQCIENRKFNYSGWVAGSAWIEAFN